MTSERGYQEEEAQAREALVAQAKRTPDRRRDRDRQSRGKDLWGKGRSAASVAWEALTATFSSWWAHHASRLAAAIAFYALLSLAPTLLVVVAIAGWVWGSGTAQEELVQTVTRTAGESVAGGVKFVLENMGLPGSGLAGTIIGVAGILVGATGFVSALKSSLNTMWEAQPQGGMWHTVRSRLVDLFLVLAAGLVLVVLVLLGAAIPYVKGVIASLPASGLGFQVFNVTLTWALFSLTFAAIYKVLPDVRIAWSDVAVGAAATGLLVTLATLILRWYLGSSSIQSMYGAAGSVVLLVFWVYYTSQVALFGAEFTQVYARRWGTKIREEREDQEDWSTSAEGARRAA